MPPAAPPITSAVESLLDLADAVEAVDSPGGLERHRFRDHMLRRFYDRRQNRPAWVGPHGALGQADVLLESLAAAVGHGLPPALYRLPSLRSGVERSRRRPVPRQMARLDLMLSEAFIAYADHLRRGLVDPRRLSPHWNVERPRGDLAGLLATALDLRDVGGHLRRLAPRHAAYGALRQALGAAAVDQGRVKANLERWRWLPRDLGSQYLLVRLTAFEVDLVADGVQPSRRRVIVGAPLRRTPSFASYVTDIVVYPSWYVPERIARDELLPRVQADSTYLAAAGFQLWRNDRQLKITDVDWRQPAAMQGLRLVQAPGGENPLGRVKFDMPNPFAIYLHDTPSPGLFGRDERDLSHGCVRVEDAVGLARSLLAGQEAAQRRFEALLAARQSGSVPLARPIPVYLMYWTLDLSDGELRPFDDLYGDDDALIREMTMTAGSPHIRDWRDLPGEGRPP